MRRSAPIGHRYYLAFIERAPDHWEPTIRDLATRVRHVKLRLRLFVQRRVRLVRRGLRRSIRRSTRWARRMRRRWLRLVRRPRRLLARSRRRWARRIQRTGRRAQRSPLVRQLQRSPAYARVQQPLQRRFAERQAERMRAAGETTPDALATSRRAGPARRVLRKIAAFVFAPTVRLPGDGPVYLVDGRGHTTDFIADRLAGRELRGIVVVDDPAVGALRQAGIRYEFLPGASERSGTGTVDIDARLGLFQLSYGFDRTIALQDVTDDVAPVSDGDLPVDAQVTR